MVDIASRVTSAYETSLVMESSGHPYAAAPGNASAGSDVAAPAADAGGAQLPQGKVAPEGTAVLTGIEAVSDGMSGKELAIQSGRSTFVLRVKFASDPALPCPSVAVAFSHSNGTVVSSAGSANDDVVLHRDASGAGIAELTYEGLPLMKGDYTVSVILACERGLHVYEAVEHAIVLRVVQSDLEQGLVKMPHRWATL